MTPQRVRRVRPSRETVTVRLTVEAEVVDGRVSEENLVAWVQEAVAKYHTFRAGAVSTGRTPMSGIRAPKVRDC